MLDILAVGETLIDFTTDRTDSAGYPTMTAHPGGAPANFLAAAAAYGMKAAFYTKVGDDYFGKTLVETLKSAGIDTRGVVITLDTFTTLAFVTLDDKGDRSFSFARKPGADTQLVPEELDLSLIDDARCVHFGTVSMTDEPARGTTKRVVEIAREKGKLVTFDPYLRVPLWKSLDDARDQIEWGVRHADVVKISLEEVEFLFGCDEKQGAERLLGDCGVKLVFVTLGKDGCYWANAQGCGYVENFADVKTVDTTGAGDIFGGTAVAKLLRLGAAPESIPGDTIAAIARCACATASISTEKFGGISSVPTPDEVTARLDK
ncbi:MAG: carbohydrate kinase [Clostridia bacterium]|nr:carbohydrate kinase [Clostridia bacterium]